MDTTDILSSHTHTPTPYKTHTHTHGSHGEVLADDDEGEPAVVADDDGDPPVGGNTIDSLDVEDGTHGSNEIAVA
ncbi:UNVERIFIED_CONTAM: hypothetical protein Sindi_3027700, partial [Sesamum indicum]